MTKDMTKENEASKLAEAETLSKSDLSALLCGFEEWLRSVCFQKPTLEAYDLAKNAWIEAAKRNNIEYVEKQFYKASEKIGW